MAKAADLDGQAGQLNGEPVIGRRQVGKDFVNQLLVFADQTTFEPPLFAAAEDVERSTAQTTQPRQNAENLKHPRSEATLAQMSGLGVPIAE